MGLGVVAPVDLDNESGGMTTKIHKVTPDRGLSTKMGADKLRFAKMPPELSLGGRHHAAELPG